MTWALSDPTGSGNPDFMILGDLNAYAKEDPMAALETAGGYTNLETLFVGPNAYSYVFSAQAGSLDHSMANAPLTPQISGATTWHINADEPTVLDYNTKFKSAGQIVSLFNADAYRISDHDPLLIGLNLLPMQVARRACPHNARRNKLMRQPSSPGPTLLRPLLVFGLILSLVSVLPVSAARLQAPDDGSYQTPPFSQNWTNTGLITTDDNWSTVPGIIGFRGDNLTAATGTDPQTILADDSPGVVDVIANQTNPNTLTSGGVAEFEISDPVVAYQGSGTADAPYL